MTSSPPGPSPRGPVAPPDVRGLAHERRDARIAHEWQRADELKAAIEASGWRVVDRGVDFALVPAIPRDQEVDGVVLHGGVDGVPSRLDAPADRPLTLLVVEPASSAGAPPGSPAAAFATLVAGAALAGAGHGEVGVDLVVARAGADRRPEDVGAEVVRLAGTPTLASLVAAGLRRARGEIVVVALPDAGIVTEALAPGAAWPGSVGPTGRDVLERLASPLADPAVVAVGIAGATTGDLRAFDAVDGGDADVLLGGILVARRADLARVLPLDERIVSADRLLTWLTLALREPRERDAEERVAALRGAAVEAIPGSPVRIEPAAGRAVVVAGLDPVGADERARAAGADRIAKRDFYRLLDRFGLDPALLSDVR